MRRVLTLLLFALAVARGQSLVHPASVARISSHFEKHADDGRLTCQVTPTRARLGFSFRFQSGYVVTVPLKQYSGPGHKLVILSRVTPRGGADPSYFSSTFKLPNVPPTKAVMEVGGGYLLGAGRYGVDWVLFDDQNRVCRKSWKIEAKLQSHEREIKMAIAPDTVKAVTFRRWSGQGDQAQQTTPIRRMTVLMHAAPLYPWSTKLHTSDHLMLFGSLASLLEALPARSVRLVVFNLDQQKELFRQDDLTPDGFLQAAQSLNGLELGVVNYHILQKPRGHINLLTDLVNNEIHSPDPSDAVVFLGPPTRYSDKFPQDAIEERTAAGPQFFYFEYKPYWGRASEFPDSIEYAMRKVKGKTVKIYNPDEFAKAIQMVAAQIPPATLSSNPGSPTTSPFQPEYGSCFLP